MIKIGERQKRELSKKLKFSEIGEKFIKFCRNRGKFINFVEIGGNMQYASMA